MNVSVILTQLFRNDNHEELCSNAEIYLQNIKWKKQDTELYLYYNYNCFKMYAYSQQLLCCCCCRLIVEHYFLKFLDIPYGSVSKKFIIMSHCEHNLNSLSDTWKIKVEGKNLIPTIQRRTLFRILFLVSVHRFMIITVKTCIQNRCYVIFVELQLNTSVLTFLINSVLITT